MQKGDESSGADPTHHVLAVGRELSGASHGILDRVNKVLPLAAPRWEKPACGTREDPVENCRSEARSGSVKDRSVSKNHRG